MAVTLSLLRTFVTVVRTGSVTRASEELVVAQSSVSGALAALSKAMGARLVERDGRGLRPTAAGAAFLPHAERILATLEDGTAAVREATNRTRRRLRVAASATAAEELLPPIWSAFRREHPTIDLTLETGNRSSVLRALDRHEADIGIGGRPPDPRIAGFGFLVNQFIVITSPADPRARRASVAPEELAASTWLIREPGSGTAGVSSEFLASRGLSRADTLTIGSDASIRGCVAVGLGIALAPRCAVERELAAGTIASIDLTCDTPERMWHALWATRAARRPAADAFLGFVQRGGAAAAVAAALATDRPPGHQASHSEPPDADDPRMMRKA